MTDFTWLNEPRNWNVENGVLTLKTEANTDFWQTTFYGFRRHSGHARLQAVSGDFTASVVVRGDYRELYDQAGLMLIIDETHWLKTGIEFTDGLMHFSVVVTNGTSDWSVIPLAQAQPNAEVHIRLTRHEAALRGFTLAMVRGRWRGYVHSPVKTHGSVSWPALLSAKVLPRSSNDFAWALRYRATCMPHRSPCC